MPGPWKEKLMWLKCAEQGRGWQERRTERLRGQAPGILQSSVRTSFDLAVRLMGFQQRGQHGAGR